MADLFLAAPWFVYSATAILGLVVGSFLNVVILRLPRMMEAAWRSEAAEILGVPASADEAPATLVAPGSRCGACGRPLKAWHNIPLVSFLLLRGRCGYCRAPISWQYPAVELLAALLGIAVVAVFGLTPFTPLALLLTWILLAAAAIDWQTQFLPDALTLPMVWLGLLASLGQADGYALVDAPTAIVGAVAGYLSLWLVYHGFRLATGKEGMGYGDFKLMAVMGAWLGWQALPMVLLLSSLAGAIVGSLLIATGALGRGKPMPFGPWIAVAGWLVLVAGDTIIAAYFSLVGLR